MNKKKELSTEQALELAQKAADAGKKEKAEKYYNAILNKYPENQDAIHGIKALNPNTLFRSDLDELKAELEDKKFRDVEVRSKMYLDLYPEVFELYHYLGIALSNQNKHGEALPVLKKAAQLNPNDADVQFHLGTSFFRQRDFKRSIVCYKKTVELSPEYGEAHFQAGNAFFELKDFKNSLEAYEIAIKFFPKSLNVLSNMADCYYSMGNHKEAIKLFKQLLEQTDKKAVIYNKIGDVQLVSGQFNDAIATYAKAIESDPSIMEFHIKQADVHKIKGDYEAAIKKYEDVLSNDVNNPVSIANLSVLNHLLGHDDKSKEYLEKLDDNLFMNLPNVVSKQFCGSYKRFMTKLLEFKENSKSKTSKKLKKIWAFGGDNALSLKGQQATFEGQNYEFDAKWTVNDRALLIAQSGSGVFKLSINHQFSKFEKGTNVLLAFGSNDFIPSALFLQDVKNNFDNIAKSVTGLATGYFNNSLAMVREHELNPIYVSIPAPVVDVNIDGAKEVSVLIQQFNAELKKLCDGEKVTYVDLFSFTDNGDGCADQSKYLEGIRLLPTAIGDALAQ